MKYRPLTDQEWDTIEPHLEPVFDIDRKRSVPLRERFNAIRYKFVTKCNWRALPKKYGNHNTVYHYYERAAWLPKWSGLILPVLLTGQMPRRADRRGEASENLPGKSLSA